MNGRFLEVQFDNFRYANYPNVWITLTRGETLV